VVQRWRQGRPFRFVKEKFGSTNPKVEFGTAQGSEIRLRGTQGSRGSVGPVYADVRRQHYKPELKGFVVSPINAREQLSHLIKGTEKQLLIYDPEISDRAMIRLLGTARRSKDPHHRASHQAVRRIRLGAADAHAVSHAYHRARSPRGIPGRPKPARSGTRQTVRAGHDRARPRCRALTVQAFESDQAGLEPDRETPFKTPAWTQKRSRRQ